MPKNKKESSDEVTKLAVATLRNEHASETAKSLAGSVLSQSSSGKQTGADMEDLASRVLQSDKYSEDTKTLAGSVLSQSNKNR